MELLLMVRGLLDLALSTPPPMLLNPHGSQLIATNDPAAPPGAHDPSVPLSPDSKVRNIRFHQEF